MIRKLLWADDQPQFVAAAQRSITDMVQEIRTVLTGDEAVAVIEEWNPDLVILDLKMPPGEWGGISCLETLGDRIRRVPVVVLSGSGMVSQCVRAMELGAMAFVEKDQVATDLRAKITSAVQKFKEMQPLTDYERIRAVERTLHETVMMILHREAARIGSQTVFVPQLVPKDVAVGAYARWFDKGRGSQEGYLFLIDLRTILEHLHTNDLVQVLDQVVRPARRSDRTGWIKDLNELRNPVAHPIRESLSSADRERLDEIAEIVTRWTHLVRQRCAEDRSA